DSPCKVRGTVKFNVTLQALWSRRKFPKQYPLYRPHAQFSKTVGRTHADSYHVWREGEELPGEMIKFMNEDDHSTAFDIDVQGQSGVLDAFTGRPIDSGTGSTSVVVIADHQHHKLSMATAIIPSPDWFIGVDSVSLCRGSHWLKSEVVDLYPMDAGTDSGATFTAPIWPEWPLKPISVITAHHPNHTASSFFYPQLKKLPPLAKLRIKRIHESTQFRVNIIANLSLSYGISTSFVVVPIDCVVSEWSTWGACSKTCGYGTWSRSRTVVSPPKYGAVPCPDLEEERRC
ncbi:hypothetical protein CAPTEDRAFT_45025, partial [Capitella teleta]